MCIRRGPRCDSRCPPCLLIKILLLEQGEAAADLIIEFQGGGGGTRCGRGDRWGPWGTMGTHGAHGAHGDPGSSLDLGHGNCNSHVPIPSWSPCLSDSDCHGFKLEFDLRYKRWRCALVAALGPSLKCFETIRGYVFGESINLDPS